MSDHAAVVQTDTGWHARLTEGDNATVFSSQEYQTKEEAERAASWAVNITVGVGDLEYLDERQGEDDEG